MAITTGELVSLPANSVIGDVSYRTWSEEGTSCGSSGNALPGTISAGDLDDATGEQSIHVATPFAPEPPAHHRATRGMSLEVSSP